MKSLALILCAAVLSGCASNTGYVNKQVVVQYQYVTRTATDQQKAIPPYPAAIDVATASQLELAEWIKQSEARQWSLESIVKELVAFYEKPFTQTEVDTLPAPNTTTAIPAAQPASAASAPARRVFKIGK